MVLTKRIVNSNNLQLNNVQGSKQLLITSSEQMTNVSLIEQLTLFFEYSASIFNELLQDVEKSNKRIQDLGTRVHNASLTLPNIEQKFMMANDVIKNIYINFLFFLKKLFFDREMV
jgi:late competence protein required for DNA uptake (superfamily II DNA/RNA helicase)